MNTAPGVGSLGTTIPWARTRTGDKSMAMATVPSMAESWRKLVLSSLSKVRDEKEGGNAKR